VVADADPRLSGEVQVVAGFASSLQRYQKGPTPEPVKAKETVGGRGVDAEADRFLRPVEQLVGRRGEGRPGGSGRPVAAGCVEVSIWPNLPAATQSVSARAAEAEEGGW